MRAPAPLPTSPLARDEAPVAHLIDSMRGGSRATFPSPKSAHCTDANELDATRKRSQASHRRRGYGRAHDHSVRRGLGKSPDRSRHGSEVRLLCSLWDLLVLPFPVRDLGPRGARPGSRRRVQHQHSVARLISCELRAKSWALAAQRASDDLTTSASRCATPLAAS